MSILDTSRLLPPLAVARKAGRWRPFLETIHVLAATIWLAAILGSSASAAILFPTMKDLNPTLPQFAAYTNDHWLLAAGSVAQRVFLVADVAAFPGAVLAAMTLMGMFWVGRTDVRQWVRPATIVRTIAIIVALACIAAMLFFVTPSLNASIGAFRAAAIAGDLQSAANHRIAFDELHPLATNLMATQAFCLLAAIAAAVWSLATPRRTAEAAS